MLRVPGSRCVLLPCSVWAPAKLVASCTKGPRACFVTSKSLIGWSRTTRTVSTSTYEFREGQMHMAVTGDRPTGSHAGRLPVVQHLACGDPQASPPVRIARGVRVTARVGPAPCRYERLWEVDTRRRVSPQRGVPTSSLMTRCSWTTASSGRSHSLDEIDVTEATISLFEELGRFLFSGAATGSHQTQLATRGPRHEHGLGAAFPARARRPESRERDGEPSPSDGSGCRGLRELLPNVLLTDPASLPRASRHAREPLVRRIPAFRLETGRDLSAAVDLFEPMVNPGAP